MEQAIEKLRADIEVFLDQLQTKKRAYEESMNNDDLLANTKLILKEIRHLEACIVSVVEHHMKDANKN